MIGKCLEGLYNWNWQPQKTLKLVVILQFKTCIPVALLICSSNISFIVQLCIQRSNQCITNSRRIPRNLKRSFAAVCLFVCEWVTTLFCWAQRTLAQAVRVNFFSSFFLFSFWKWWYFSFFSDLSIFLMLPPFDETSNGLMVSWKLSNQLFQDFNQTWTQLLFINSPSQIKSIQNF